MNMRYAETPPVDAPIDLKALLVEREDCDAGTVQKLREGLAQGGAQFKALRDVNATLQKKLEASPPAVAKKMQLKLGIANYFLGYMGKASEHLRHAEVPLGYFYLGRSLANVGQYEEALKALNLAEKSGYSAPQVQLQRANVHRLKGEVTQAESILAKLEELASHSAEFHFQKACCIMALGDKVKAIKSLEKAIEFDPGHTGALFQLGYYNDLAGNDQDAINFYERCLKYPPVHKGTINNLGVLYEDSGRYDKAADCYQKLVQADPNDDQARLFLKDAKASLDQNYSPEEEQTSTMFRQVLEIPVTDFELSVRSRNCLKKMGIRTLGDLTRVTEASLLGSKNFGETSLDEIKIIMTAKGLRIGQSLEQGTAYEMMRFRPQQQLTPEEQAVMNKPVSDLNLSVRARKCMNRLQILTIGELISRTADELLEAKNFGQTSLTEIREKLTEMGIKLRGD
jgi:DNA-directed RNA polymerase subunit alpha